MYKSGRCPSVTATIDAEMEGVVRVCVPLWHTPIMPASQTPLHPENCILRTVRCAIIVLVALYTWYTVVTLCVCVCDKMHVGISLNVGEGNEFET